MRLRRLSTNGVFVYDDGDYHVRLRRLCTNGIFDKVIEWFWGVAKVSILMEDTTSVLPLLEDESSVEFSLLDESTVTIKVGEVII